MAVIKKQSKVLSKKSKQDERVKKKTVKSDAKPRRAVSKSELSKIVKESINEAPRPYNKDWEKKQEFTGM